MEEAKATFPADFIEKSETQDTEMFHMEHKYLVKLHKMTMYTQLKGHN